MNNFSTRLPVNMSTTGIATFDRCPLCTDLTTLKAHIAVLGAPCDIAIQGRPGARLGPRGIRAASARCAYVPGGAYSWERGGSFLDAHRWSMVDCGDADYIPGDIAQTFENITAAVALIARRGAMPVVLGGDHSITFPVVRGLESLGQFNIIQIDAHLDWTASIGSQTMSNGSPLRNAAALPWVGKILHLGIRGSCSSGPEDYADAIANGDVIHSVRDVRRLGIGEILQVLEPGSPTYVTLDIDGMDASCTPGTAAPTFGGFLYDEMVDIFEAIAEHTHVIGMDVVEVSPPYDWGETTSYLAARLVTDMLGYVTRLWERAERAVEAPR